MSVRTLTCVPQIRLRRLLQAARFELTGFPF